MIYFEDAIAERDLHVAQLKQGRFRAVHARQIAKAVAAIDKSDPFIADRVFTSLMNGDATPADFTQYVKMKREPNGDVVFAVVITNTEAGIKHQLT